MNAKEMTHSLADGAGKMGLYLVPGVDHLGNEGPNIAFGGGGGEVKWKVQSE